MRVARDVYTPALFAESLLVRVRAAILCSEGEGIVSGLAGLFMTRVIEDAPDTALLVLSRQHHVTRVVPRVRYYRASVAPPFWEIDGCRVAEPEWCLLHAMRELATPRRVDLALTALASDAISVDVISDMLQRFPYAKGRKELAAAVTLHLDGVHSPIERRGLQDVMAGPEFADFRRQVEVVADGRTYVADALSEEAMLVVEFDGERGHIKPDRVARDRERDARLASVGLQTLRFSGTDVMKRPDWCRAMILAVIDHREGRSRAA